MRVYREVPHWWYAILGILSVVMLSIAIERFPTELPIWGMLLGLLLSGILAIPITMIQAITNQQIGLNVISELIAGYLFEGKPVANMIFKCIGVQVCGQASSFSGDMKLGHYMKVPPRVMFAAQTIATIVSCFVLEAVQSAMLANIPDICTPGQKHGYTCAGTNTFATASLVWGGIGPRRFFSPGAMYAYLFLNLNTSLITFIQILQTIVLFASRSTDSNSILLPLPSLPLLILEIHQYASLLRHRCNTASHRDQLRLMGNRRIHLQLRHAPKTLPLVDAIQLYPVRCSGLRSDSEHDCHLSSVAAS
jgi:OPT family oligopeptide transporter